MKKKLKEIFDANGDLRQNLEKNPNMWSFSYNRKADMLVVGEEFPIGSFFYQVKDGIMLRIDDSNKIYGFAIENTKDFISNNKEIGFLLSFIVYPVRSLLFKLPYYFIMYHTIKGLNKMFTILPVTDRVFNKVQFT